MLSNSVTSKVLHFEQVTFNFSAFSSFSHLWLDLTSCLLVNFKLKMESSSFSPPIAGLKDQANPVATFPKLASSHA